MLKQFNTLLRAKLVYNKKKEVYKIVAAFNITQKTDKGTFIFPAVNKCDFISTEFSYETLTTELQCATELMQLHTRTTNFEFV
jgi:hypothetical protein